MISSRMRFSSIPVYVFVLCLTHTIIAMQNTHREGEATALYTLVCQHLSESSKSQTFLAQQVILTNYHVYAAAA